MSPVTSRPRLLITGFGPFPGVPCNPTAELARRIAGSPRLARAFGAPPMLLVMRTAYAAIADELEPALAEKPDAVLMFGVSRRARNPRVEFRASNRASALYPDATGRTHRLTLDPAGPVARRSRAAAKVLYALQSSGGVRVSASRDAGRYLCNASYFRVLAEGGRAVFLHIPPLPAEPARRALTFERWTRIGVIAALVMAGAIKPPKLVDG